MQDVGKFVDAQGGGWRGPRLLDVAIREDAYQSAILVNHWHLLDVVLPQQISCFHQGSVRSYRNEISCHFPTHVHGLLLCLIFKKLYQTYAIVAEGRKNPLESDTPSV